MASFIREITPQDDFVTIASLMQDTWNRFMESQGIRSSRRVQQPDALRELFFPTQDSPEAVLDHKPHGFVYEVDGSAVAVMGVGLSRQTQNGHLLYGFQDGYEDELIPLLKRCMSVVRDAGGIRCVRFTTMLPGRIRNAELGFWERLGFVADEYFYALIKLDLADWSTPDDLDTTGVQAEEGLDLQLVASILDQDGDEQLADEFQTEFAEKSKESVFLSLRTENNEVAGIAYYRVQKFQDQGPDGKLYDGLGAWSVGVHFRPEANLDRREKSRFIQCVLASMKQLDVIFASGRISSRDFDAFIELLAQGFYFQGQPTVTTRLTRRV